MTIVRVAAVQASYVLMDRDAIWTGWRRSPPMRPPSGLRRLAEIAREHAVWLIMGVDERDPHGTTIYDSVLTFSPNGELVDKHRKLVPTGSERTVWGMGDGSTLRVTQSSFGRFGGLICWENYLPSARFHLYAQGIDIWLAPTVAQGDGWIATLRHIARENATFVIGVNTLLHADDVPADFPDRDKLIPTAYRAEHGDWVEPGNSVIIDPSRTVRAGPVHEREERLIADLDLDFGQVLSTRRMRDPVGHYHRPDIFRLSVDTAPRPAVTGTSGPTP